MKPISCNLLPGAAMFQFSNKRSNQIKIIDKISLTQNAKWENCLHEWKQNKNTVFVAWFDETLNALNGYIVAALLLERPEIFRAVEIQFTHVQNNPVIFLEHFPLHNKEAALFERLHLTEAVVYSSLDEPLFLYAGAGNISKLAQTLGMKENEILQHNMISNSIKQIQKKLEGKITVEQSAPSQQQWMNANVSNKNSY